MDVDQLLAGPRGRGLCLALLHGDKVWDLTVRANYRQGNDASFGWFASAYGGMPTNRLSARLQRRRGKRENQRRMATPVSAAEFAEALNEAAAAMSIDRVSLIDALRRTVDEARYWQRPDGVEALLADSACVAALRPVADAVAALVRGWSPAWDGPLAAEQWQVTFEGYAPQEPVGRTPKEILATSAERTRDHELVVAASGKRSSGSWWSTPPRGLTVTAGAMPGVGPLGLFLVEDELGWDSALVAPVTAPSTRVLEINDAHTWAELCRAHPMDVSAQTAEDWEQTTGRVGAWVIPDWQSVATEWDGVHLTVAGYLEGATRAIPVDDTGATVIAGWNPDATYWLVAATASGPECQWRRGETTGWVSMGQRDE